ncbi:hypothetical protein HMPREF3036_02342 [Sutterella sp. KLE1602]|nr:hypothetical protein HMPREF3036_02342 [Sutterella sp. KLE1602]
MRDPWNSWIFSGAKETPAESRAIGRRASIGFSDRLHLAGQAIT